VGAANFPADAGRPGIDALLNGFTSREALQVEELMAGLLAAACLGSWLGSRLARRRMAAPPA